MSEDAKDPAALLVQAVGTLQPEDRDAVLAWLLRRDVRGISGAVIGQPGPAQQVREVQLGVVGEFITAQAPGAGRPQPGAGRPQPGAGRPQPGAQQVVPVRFPAEQHAQLREWCAEHGFSMATVIRGLVARFLEMQLPERN